MTTPCFLWRRARPAASLVAVVFLALPALAQNLEQALQGCLAVEDAAARLACFEHLARLPDGGPAMSAPVPEGPQGDAAAKMHAVPGTLAVVPPRPETGDAPKDRFGLPPERTVEQLEQRREMVIAEVRKASRGEWILVMDNGQVWRQTDRARLPDIRPGTVAVVEQGALGGFLLTIDRRSLRAKRIK